jgi:hypothetical protein
MNLRRRQNNTKTDDVRNDYRISHIVQKKLKIWIVVLILKYLAEKY